MKKIISDILQELDKKQLYNNIESLWKTELPQTFKAYTESAAHTLGLLQQEGIENAEIINFPADGKTVYQDKRMPLAWDASVGKLNIKKSSVPFPDPVVADYQRHPFHLIKGSNATVEGGQMVRIITEAQLFAGEDVNAALVICDPQTMPNHEILKPALDLGALGLISDFSAQQYRNETSKAIPWTNACTGGANWHIQCEDRPFTAFSVTPETGDLLRHAAAKGELTAIAECDGRLYEGTLPAVTAVVPGRQKKELWLMAHLFEPLSDDNSTGVAGAIEIVRCIKELIAQKKIPELEFSIRLVFAAEFYGFAAFADKMGGYLGDKVVGAINLDSVMAGNPGQKLHVYLAPPGSPFFGNSLMEMLIEATVGMDEQIPPVHEFHESGTYEDDTFLSDKSVGVPTIWPIGKDKHLWHNSALTMETIDINIFAGTCAFLGSWIAMVSTLDAEKLPETLPIAGSYGLRHLNDEYKRILVGLENGSIKPCRALKNEITDRMKYRLQIDIERLRDFSQVANIEQIKQEVQVLTAANENLLRKLKTKTKSIKTNDRNTEKWFAYASTIVPERATVGLPYDQVKIPLAQRRPLPDSVIYGPFSRILSNMDGKKNLQRIIREAEWEEQTVFSEKQVKKYIGGVMQLADYGYLKVDFRSSVNQMDIVKALQKLGVKAGDCLMVHSSVSTFGRIEGGANTVIDSLLEVLDENGTLMFPTFTVPFATFDGNLNKNRQYRPFDKDDACQIWVGKIPQTFLGRDGVIRSEHPSHSVAGTGPLATKYLNAHKETDSPTGATSPFAKLVKNCGKILYFGAELGSSTFLHYLEDYRDMPYLHGALCSVKDESKAAGKRMVYVPKHLPGDRDFYRQDSENCKFFKAALAAGLTIKEVELGLGKLRLIDAKELFEIGLKLLKEAPDLLLCDNHECMFCSKYKSNHGKFFSKQI